MRNFDGVIWDFDGTLGERPGLWSGCVLEVLSELVPDHGLRRADIAAHLHAGFPWHTPLTPHPELSPPGKWWEYGERVIAAACENLGYLPGRARSIASAVHERYVDGNVAWRVYPDAARTLARLADAGSRQVILSNHVPELPDIVTALGLSPYLASVLTSAATGYEKPHRAAYAAAAAACGPAEKLWMVGDSLQADYLGPREHGISGLLLSRDGRPAEEPGELAWVPDLIAAADRILACSQGSRS